MSYDLSMEDLSKYFHLPINDVAKELGVCATVLKKICRKKGIKRWPHRKIKSLNNMIADLERITPATESDRAALAIEISTLKEKREFLLRNPNVSYKSVVPKYCVSSCQTRVSKAVSNGEVQPSQGQAARAEGEAAAKVAASRVGGKRKRSAIDPGQEENAVNVLFGLLTGKEDEAESQHSPEALRPISPVLPPPSAFGMAEFSAAPRASNGSNGGSGGLFAPERHDRMAVEGQAAAHSKRSALLASSEAVSLIGQLPGMPVRGGVEAAEHEKAKAAAVGEGADSVHSSKRRKLFDNNSAPFRSLPPIHPFSSMQPMHPFTASSMPLSDFRVVPTMPGTSPVHSPY
eukprot:TRINITY_DN383_c0_g1_i1.p1 TRINITY_DN383_c0_g1~~TRINITY_DN383_c0_g1_i1.p1  ORF type:complete len:346 (-),score=158.15 TRINITY_DN383_c0_g1_i1:501-1538(-)